MAEVIILEDDPPMQRAIRRMLGQGLPYEIVKTGEALRKRLAQQAEHGIFFLDDEIPEQEGGLPDFRFIANAGEVLRVQPDARIFYTGGMPNETTKAFCAQHKIQMIHKTEIASVLAKMSDSAT